MMFLVRACMIAAIALGAADAADARVSRSKRAKPAAAREPTGGDYKSRHVVALEKAMAGDAKGALAILTKLTSATMPLDELDRVYLSLGRVHYQAGDSEAALEAFQKVRKGSASWLEALEEKAWTHVRMGKFDDALASLKTVLSPLFQDKIRTEPFFLTSLAQLRVCDYSAMFKTIDQFKSRFRDRVKSWESSNDPAMKGRLKEASETIQKLNLVEAEAIQRLYIDVSGKRHSGSAPKIGANGANQLTFPEVEGDEVWLDEVDDFRVTVKGCPKPAIIPRTMLAKKERSK